MIIDGIRSDALLSDLFTAAIGQAMETFSKTKNLGSSELFGAIGALNSTLKTIAATMTEKIPE